MTAHFNVEYHGSIVLIDLLSDEASAWVDEHVHEPIWFGPRLAVELRYAGDIVEAMLEELSER